MATTEFIQTTEPFSEENEAIQSPFLRLNRTLALPTLTPRENTTVNAAEIDELTLLLTWLLFLSRQQGVEDVNQIVWGVCRNGSPEALLNMPKASESSLLSHAYAVDELRRQTNQPTSRLGDCEKLFFCDLAAPTTSNLDPEMSDATARAENFRLEVRAVDEQLAVEIEWRRRTMTALEVEMHLGVFAAILAMALASLTDPTIDVFGPLPSDFDQIWAWNATVPANISECMHDLISLRAAQHPEALAVSSWDGEFTYGHLEELSTRLAHRLRANGVCVGSRVPLCFEKSKWTVVAVLAVMKAGAAFVLMDPSQPEARLRTIVEQTGASTILCSHLQNDLASRIASGAHTIVVSDGLDTPDSDTNLEVLPSVPASAPMYVIFTSGSTGKPKGIVISHENYTSGALPRADAVGYAENLRVFEFSSYAFDVSIDCILCTLVKGGCICTPSDEARMNDLSSAIRASNAKMAHMTPSVARVLDSDILPSLDVLGLGGEAVSASDAIAWNKQTKIIIAYGPSECTVGCTINNDVGRSQGYANIGKGVGGLMWIVDPSDHNRLVPLGAVGELLVEGPILGVGYLNEPEKTAEAFINSPPWLLAGHAGVPGRQTRLYKTGDLVRYDQDGSSAIVFVGRKDQQVKLRGQRVELAEIEHHLRKKLPGSVQLAAEVITPGGSEPSLVVFLAEPEQVDPGTEGALKFSDVVYQALSEMDDYLGAELPRYMVPTAYIPLAKIPSLVSGKIDRKQLREMGRAMTREQISQLRIVPDVTTPETPEEHALHGAWASVLGSNLTISTGDSFFALGGDSLKAMKLVSAVRTRGFLLTVASVFQYPTLRDMAALLTRTDENAVVDPITAFSLLEKDWSAQAATAEAAMLCNIDESLVEDVYPCTPLQEALAALSAKFKDAYVAQRVVALPDEETAQRLKAAFNQAAETCPILRTRIVQVPSRGLMQVVVKETPRWRQGASVQEYLEQDRAEEMVLGSAMVRYGLVSEAGTFHFVWTVHHSIYDGWSMPLVIDRVNRAYQGLETERAAHFNHFIHYLQNIDQEACRSFWLEQLRGATGPQFPALPWEGYQARSDSLLEVFIPVEGRAASNTTIAAVIRGAWALTASQYAGSGDMVFGETLTGRDIPLSGAEEIEGPMITTIPVRVRIDREASVMQYLETIHAQMAAQMPYEHMGLQHIRKLSADALQACELRTGLVLNPASQEQEPTSSVDLPANGLMPAGDAEAAQEALNFNTYGLMLVCSLGPTGILVMASFDSKMVDKPTMERALDRFSLATQQLHSETDKKLGDLEYMTDHDRDEIWRLSSTVTATNVDPTTEGATGIWLVDLLDAERLVVPGAVGELVFETTSNLSLPFIENPTWLSDDGSNSGARLGRLYKTGKLARILNDGTLVAVERAKPTAMTPPPLPTTSAATAVTSEKQKKLRTLWGRVLGMDETVMGLSDNFFRLGGDSIAAMKLASEARARGLLLKVADIFVHRSLFAMSNASVECSMPQTTQKRVKPFQSLDMHDVNRFVTGTVQPSLPDSTFKIVDVLPTRPLQEIAVTGTVDLPRYSMRYELLHFDTPIKADQLREACQALVDTNEILRTVFMQYYGSYYGVVLENITVPFVEYDVQGDAEAFARSICGVDVQERVLPGSPFVRWFLVHGDNAKSTLVFRISHAQYDELCLPILLRQLSAIYERRTVPASVPFSSFVHHVIRDAIPRSIDYWTALLQGSSMTILKPDIPATARRHFAISRTVDMSARSRDITVATLPTAAWALTLARRLGLDDVVFGEVASGRNTDLPGCDAVVGPCWQYIPVRVRLGAGMTGTALLQAIQDQHHASAAYEGMALPEIVRRCTDWPVATDWFDSVVHQDVEHVEQLGFGATRCKTETLYMHEEPLREWKVQAYPQGDTITLEIVTFESWGAYATELLDDLVRAFETLVQRPGDVLGLEA